MSIYLGVDIGTSGAKTLAIRPDGKVVAQASAEYPLHHPKPLWSEQDPEDWWRATVATIRSALKKGKIKPAEVKAIGLSGQMHGSVFLDRRGKVLRRAILWNDQRTAAECEEIERRAGGRRALVKLVANPALTGFTAPKILWLRNHEPKLFERTAKVLLPKDEVRRRLTGEYATEVSDASGMLLLDVKNRCWSKKLLTKLELDPDLLAPCYESEEVTGQLTKPVAEELGLTADCLVVGGAGDCAAGAVGNGVVKRGVVLVSLGTSGVVFAHSPEPQVDPDGRLHTFCHAVRGAWHTMGVTLSAAGSLQWFRDALCGDAGFDQLTAEAADTPPGAEGLQFLPYLAGERTPHADPTARGAFVGLTLSHARGHMTRSVLEGVTYSLRDCLDIMQQMGVPVRQVRASGGGAKSPFWRGMLADVFGKSVRAMAHEEGPAMGVALLAAVGAGEYRSVAQACDAVVETAEESKPSTPRRKYYDRAFGQYQALYSSLKDDFRRLGELG